MTTRPSFDHEPHCGYRWTWAEHYPAPCTCWPDPWWWVVGAIARRNVPPATAATSKGTR